MNNVANLTQKRIALRGSGSPCQGRVEIFQEKQWGLVCRHGWNNVNSDVVCSSLGCGKHSQSVYGEPYYDHPPLPKKFWLDEVKCNGSESNLWDCPHSGLGHTDCTGNYVAVTCGNAFKEAEMVCKELNCGKHHKILKPGTFVGEKSSYIVPLSCTGREEFSWQCVDWVTGKHNTCTEEASIICSEHKHLRLSDEGDVCQGTIQEKRSDEKEWRMSNYTDIHEVANDTCAKMRCGESASVKPINETQVHLTCTDRVKVELKQSKCFGDLYVNVNTTKQIVCSDGLSQDELNKIGKVVCRQLKCGNVLHASPRDKMENGLLSKVQCSGEEHTLWECPAKYELSRPCRGIQVTCAVIDAVSLKDGLSRCSGRLEVKFRNSWWMVSNSRWSPINSDVVCQQLGCGKSEKKNELFVKSSNKVLELDLTCTDTSNELSKCSWSYWREYLSTDKVVNIFCTENKLRKVMGFHLKGNSSCEGEVEVNSTFLKAEGNDCLEKANEACWKTNCSALKSSNCPTGSSRTNSTSNTTNLYVNCVGTVEVKLTNPCWGDVEVCFGSECGGICEQTWTNDLSDMLCENLGCGTAFRGDYLGKKTATVTVGSVHCDGKKNFSQCNFVRLNATCSTPASVTCTRSVKARLLDTRDKCAGNLEMFYLGGWASVCTDNMEFQTKEAICTSMGCGNADNFTLPIPLTNAKLSGITCKNNLATCTFGGTPKNCQTGYINCTEWRRFILVEPGEVCSGMVYVFDSQGRIPVSREAWGVQKGSELCQNLQCGEFNKYIEKLYIPSNNRTYNCSGTNKTIFDCKVQITPTPFQPLNIKCAVKHEIKLQTSCTGEVVINSQASMCWQPKNPERVFNELCQNLQCSKFITSWSTNKTKSKALSFSCLGVENRLWQCKSWNNNNCKDIVSVACAKGLKLEFKEKCGGELQVNYIGKWEPICVNNMEDAHRLCNFKSCGNATKLDHLSNTKPKISFSCEGKEYAEHQCFKPEACSNGPAYIECQKYVATNSNAELISGLVVTLLLVVVIVIWQRKRLLALLRSKSSSKDQDVELSSNTDTKREVDLNDRKSSMFEMDDYVDVDPIMNPVETKSQDLQPDEGEEERKDVSEGSSRTEYDDVEENEASQEPENSPTQPLLPPRPANLLDDVSYEVELDDPDDYDDAMPAQAAVSEERGSPVSVNNESANGLAENDEQTGPETEE
ncbi:scavenger receptor cysteine-rich type 1 protein M160 [Hoplias malabaricus]|uniref:scavenger receptor cysteine-rich type 1 protein M160 n=1 Tax=Hoplias malabaricus TaxID=27720 RepID=UPI00346277C4